MSLNGDVSIRKDVFLKKSANKSSLASVYTKFIEESYETLGDKTLYLSRGSGDVGIKADCNGINQIDSLTSNQEEADTRMILHCIKAVNNGAKVLIIRSNDTDVLVLLIHHFPVINAEKIYLIVGVKGRHTDNTRSIAVHDIYRKLTPAQQAVIIPVYCITGYDTVSSFYGIGKRTVFKIFMKIAHEVGDMSELGEGYLSSSVVDACTYFVGVLYGNQSTSKLNSLRASLALKRSPKKIPPTDTSFRLHILQAAYQFSIWKQAPCGIQSQIDPLIWNDAIVPLMSTEACDVPELLRVVVCDCTNGDDCNESCCCYNNEQACTYECGCHAALPLHIDIDNEEEFGSSIICLNTWTAQEWCPIDNSDDEDILDDVECEDD